MHLSRLRAVASLVALTVACGPALPMDAARPGLAGSAASAVSGPCAEGDSAACTKEGAALGAKQDLRSARAVYEVACRRYMASIPDNAAQLAEAMASKNAAHAVLFGAAPAPVEELDSQLGFAPGATARSRASEEMQQQQRVIKEIAARVQACADIADSFEFSEDAKALPYFDALCELRPIVGNQSNDTASISVNHGCESGQIIRQNHARAEQFRAQFAAQMSTAIQGAATNIGRGVATYQAAKRGQIYVPPGGGGQSFSGAGAGASGAGPAGVNGNAGGAAAPATGGSCPDSGRGCAAEASVQAWKAKCSGGAQAACYCVAAATSQCFLARGCYAEAGALRADGTPTNVRQAFLQSSVSSNEGKAGQLGTSCATDPAGSERPVFTTTSPAPDPASPNATPAGDPSRAEETKACLQKLEERSARFKQCESSCRAKTDGCDKKCDPKRAAAWTGCVKACNAAVESCLKSCETPAPCSFTAVPAN
jgi:hypothetical protein